MKWIKASERVPNNDGNQWIRIDGETKRLGLFFEDEDNKPCCYIPSNGAAPEWTTYSLSGIEWLDDTNLDEEHIEDPYPMTYYLGFKDGMKEGKSFVLNEMGMFYEWAEKSYQYCRSNKAWRPSDEYNKGVFNTFMSFEDLFNRFRNK